MRNALAICALVVTLAHASADDRPNEPDTATDPAKAGPSWGVQGEYVGDAADKSKLGAEVICRGQGNYLINLLPGGLRGEGGEYARRLEGKGTALAGTSVGEAVDFKGDDGKWGARVLRAQNGPNTMTGKTADGRAFVLKRVVRQSKTLGEKPPPGAVVLFDGTNADQWKDGKMADGNLLGSDVASKREFKDHTFHLEFRLSYMPRATGQERSNSGVYVQNRYEVQVLDSFGLKGEANECGAVYGQAAPLVNMCFPPLQWQTYDIDFKAARVAPDGKKTQPAVITVRHNGVLVHDKFELKGPTAGGTPENDRPGPLFLQGHGGQVQYRNVWVVEPARPAE
jgi:hypothetical protein